jgi:hypothetical protein
MDLGRWSEGNLDEPHGDVLVGELVVAEVGAAEAAQNFVQFKMCFLMKEPRAS